MVKAAAMKKRYIEFQYIGSEATIEGVKNQMMDLAQKFFGELGLSEAALKIVEYDENKKIGILRCQRDYLKRVLGFLALADSLNGVAVRFIALRSSGTLKSLDKTDESTQDK
jgi:RNase P/RNase MRP subunit POP5